MIAFKGTKNFQCKDMKYEVGETYNYDKELILCKQGYHFCKKLENINSYYPLFSPETIILKIEILGDIIDNSTKSVTNKFRVLEIIPKNKYYLYSKKLTKNSIKFINDNIWEKIKFNKNGYVAYFENSFGFWQKYKYDKNNNLIYYADSK